MIPWIAATTLLSVLAAGSPAEPDGPRYEPARPDPQRDALGILRHGDAYLGGVALPGDAYDAAPAFVTIDAPLAQFLESPDMQPSVQFSCAVMSTPGEARLTKALSSRDHARALIALAALVHVHSPSTVDAQLAALGRLRAARPKWTPTLREIESRFEPEALTAAIEQDPPADDRYGDVPALEWAIVATGARTQETALLRLAVLCKSDHLHTSLAAERSIEDFRGPPAEAALASCIEGWRYNAADRAFDALRDRNPALARKALIGMALPPEDTLYRYADALVDVAAPAVVTRLIAVIPDLDNPGRAIGALESHAAPRHHAGIRRLASQVDERHRERLERLAEKLAAHD